MSNKQPSPKADAMRALREERYEARQRELKEAQQRSVEEKAKPVKRKRGKE